MSEVIEQLKELMKTLGETDYSLQNKAHISQSTIYRIVEGKTSDPGIHKVDDLARAMGHCLSIVPLSEFNQELRDLDDVKALSEVIAMIDGLAEARGFSLSPIEKAELILANYQSPNDAQSPKQKTHLNVVNLDK